jgi:hypothetical protein
VREAFTWGIHHSLQTQTVYLSAGRGGKREGEGASENGVEETGFLHFIYFAICVCVSQGMGGRVESCHEHTATRSLREPVNGFACLGRGGLPLARFGGSFSRA